MLPPLVKSLFYGFSFELLSVTPSRVEVAGETLSVLPTDLSLQNDGGYLLIRGTLDVS